MGDQDSVNPFPETTGAHGQSKSESGGWLVTFDFRQDTFVVLGLGLALLPW